jgi:hypothetical protein
LHIANRSVAVVVRVDVQVSRPVAAVTELVAAPSRLPLVTWKKGELRNYGALTRAHHDFEIAKRRLTRFELKASAGLPPQLS